MTTSEPGSAAMERIVEEIAKKIARRRMLDGPPSLAMYPVERFEEAFERVWTGTADLDERQRQNYRADAKIAATYIETLTRERDEARANMEKRDQFLVDNDMWTAFVASLPALAGGKQE